MEWFLPGERAGGPVWTVYGLVRHLALSFDFAIVCRNRDLDDARPYKNVPSDTWIEFEGQQLRYLSGASERSLGMLRVLRSKSYEVLFPNTLFSVTFCLIPLLARRMRLIPRRRVLLAPRGQLDPGALTLSARKKRCFLRFLELTGLLEDVEWAASTAQEARHIRAVVGSDSIVYLAPDLRVAGPAASASESSADRRLRVCFLSRISPKKNLLEALRVIALVHVPVQFDIFGPREDRLYWQTCERAMANLPPHVQARWMGGVAHEHVPAILSRYDLFLLPTLGENFGHAIVEALAAGCPVMISDRTPWRRLAEHDAGWDLPLGDPKPWAAAIDGLAVEDDTLRLARRESAQRFAAAIGRSPEAIAANVRALGGVRT
jgi:glycosyltransferase involved in cell wall biosynthesis